MSDRFTPLEKVNMLIDFPKAILPQDEVARKAYLQALSDYAKTNPAETLLAVKQQFDPSWDFSLQRQYYRIFETAQSALNGSVPTGLKALRVAVIGSKTLTQLTWLLTLNLLGSGFLVDLYESDYGVFQQEILNPQSGLYIHQPQVLFALTDYRDILNYPDMMQQAHDVETVVEQEYSSWAHLWHTFHERTHAVLIQNNFDLPDVRLLGNLESRLPGGRVAYIQRLNRYMADHVPNYVLLHDLDYLTSYYGKRQWYDPRFYFFSKQPCAFGVLPAYAASLTAIVRAQWGMGRKCLVLDLDNTLWGGVIGDDGVAGIVVGPGTPQGEAYLELQNYACQLKERGILLAVCSKNDLHNAQSPFLEIPDMALKLEDFSCFIANWDPKPDNLRVIARHLNISTDALVFVDDNPVERAMIREYMPEVAVPELPEDPAFYIRTLVEGAYFEPVTLSEEDRERTRMILENQQREQLAQSTNSVDGFLKQLDMVAEIRPFTEIDLDRIAQLVVRSNQFNLTTQRYSRAELQALMLDSTVVTRTVRLKDRFGDNGLICVWIGKLKDEDELLTIDTWLMSCRVLSRGVEQNLLNHVLQYARQKDIKRIQGLYIPTQKNKLVQDHYSTLGFNLIHRWENGTTEWELVVNTARDFVTFIANV